MSSNRRRELEQSLPPASEYLCRHMADHILQAGLQVNNQDILLLGRVISDYFMNTAHGKHTALKLLKASLIPASTLKSYYPNGDVGKEYKKINPKDLVEYRGYVFKGQHAISHDDIEVDDREDASICEACGGRFPVDYCMKSVEVMKNHGSNRVELWCNHCRSSSETPRIRDTSNTNTCLTCEKLVCDFHPKNPGTQRLLPAPKRRDYGTPITGSW